VRSAIEPLQVEIAAGVDPAQALLALRDDRAPFALAGRWAGGGAIAGSEPLRIVTGADATFETLAQPALDTDRDDLVGGGWFGYLGFALAHAVERLPAAPPAPRPLPAAALAYYDHVLRIDERERCFFEALVTPERREAIEARLAELRERLAAPPAPRPWRLERLAPRAPGYAGHRAAVADCIERIAAGELLQANLCLRFDGVLLGEPIDAFVAGLEALQPAYGAYLDLPGATVLSFSPELFLRRRGRLVETAPIKGTARRPADPAEAEAERRRLAASVKDAAENVMILDLMRNDLGRVCRYGSVRAEPLPRVEAHPGVWHLVSDARGELRDDVDDAELLRATFPPGSVTGAPKVQALKVISALEATAREVYTGAIGYASPAAGLELNVAIRTFEVAGDGRVWLGAGGGIVADSDPDEEVREAWRKAAPLASALGAELEPPGELAPAPRAPRIGGPRPRPEHGVLETLAVDDGEPQALGAHLARLAASARRLYGAEPPAGLAEEIRAAAARAPAGRARLRVRAEPAEGGVDWHVEEPQEHPGGDPAPVWLEPVVLPGGLGEHKWADRRLVDERSGPGRAPLFCDLDGAVLEAGFANVWIAEGERLLTPPADGRLLPGVTRARVLASWPGAGEEPFGLDRLAAADAVVLTSAVALATPAGLGGPPTARALALAAELRTLLATSDRPPTTEDP